MKRNEIKGTVDLDGRKVAYTLTRKKVKNINIRVRSDGTVGVSASPAVPQQYIEMVLRKKASFLLGALSRFEDIARRQPEEGGFNAGDTLYYLGEPHLVQILEGKRSAVEREPGILWVTVPDPEDPARREAALQAFFRLQCAQVTERLCREIQPKLAPFGVPLPEIRVRSMISRWGSCKPSACRATFALRLVEAPLPCIEYVVWHELIHFIHPNHSKDFYDCLAAFLPDWKQRRTVLNTFSYRGERERPEDDAQSDQITSQNI